MPNAITNKPVYEHGRYRILPLVTLLVLEVEGRRLQVFDTAEIELAVSEADRLAESEGLLEHCSC